MAYDVIVVGARCAGSPTAMLLARKGYRVLLIDRVSFPSDTVSTHVVWPPGVGAMKRWGLLDRLVNTGCPSIEKFTMDFGIAKVTGAPPPLDGIRTSYAPRRMILDHLLVEAAAAAGAEVRTSFSLTGLISDNGTVLGIKGHSRNGGTVEERARIVVGADGIRSLVANAVSARVYDDQPARTFNSYTYWNNCPSEGFHSFGTPQGFSIGMFPTHHGCTLVNVIGSVDKFLEYKSNVEANYLKIVTSVPELAERLSAAKRVERFYSTADLPNYFKRPFGPGWALVGDAGYVRDPISAQGITDSFCSAELLTQAIDEAFSGKTDSMDAFAEYERHRNAQVSRMYDFTLLTASLSLAPEDIILLQAISKSPKDSDDFFGAFVGTVPIRKFHHPLNITRILNLAHSLE